MPHIHEVFLEDSATRDFLRLNKHMIRTTIAELLGYPEEDVALIPNRIPKEDIELADNLLPLEFVIDSGTHTLGHEDELAERISRRIVETCYGAHAINFGVWVVSHGKNGFAEHKPV